MAQDQEVAFPSQRIKFIRREPWTWAISIFTPRRIDMKRHKKIGAVKGAHVKKARSRKGHRKGGRKSAIKA